MSFEPLLRSIVPCCLVVACGTTSVQPAPLSQCVPPTASAAQSAAEVARSREATVEEAPRLVPPARWILLGSFPHPELDAPSTSGAPRAGLDEDYLTPLGGEAEAVITAAAANKFDATVRAIELESDPTGMVHVNQAFEGSSDRILYAYAELPSEIAQKAIVHFGVEKAAKVWVNGTLVHRRVWPTRTADRSDEEFSIQLQPGQNRVLVKIDGGSLGAEFVFVPFTEAAHRVALAEGAERRFPDEDLVFADGGNSVRSDSTLPAVKWGNVALARWALGTSDLEYTWYGPEGNPTSEAGKLGLYTAIVSYRTRSGVTVRRSLPLLRTTPEFYQNLDLRQLTVPKPRHLSWKDWKFVEASVSAWAGGATSETPGRVQSLPVVLKEVLLPPGTSSVDLGSHASMVRWQQTQLDLKRKLLGLGEPKRVAPALRSAPAPVLRPGSARDAGIKPEVIATLRKIAAEWAQADRRPFVLVVARHGVVFLHETFGSHEGKALPLSFRFRPAALGKTFAALVFAQFVEQGLLTPSQAVGEVLKPWPTEGSAVITFRQLFDHTAGLTGHASYGGLDNPWLEEAFAAHVLPTARPGQRYRDEGNGNNIAAKAMELVDGRAFPILQREVLFSRLGATSIDQWDCGWADAATALDVAKVAQMLLQKGAYGDWQFFGEDTWKQLLPTRLSDIYPNLRDPTLEVGVGLQRLWDPEDSTEPASAGHAAGKHLHSVGYDSSSVFRVDYQHDLILVAARVASPNQHGHERYLRSFVRALELALVD